MRPFSTLYPTLLRILILAYAFNQFALITADPDLWGHIKFGEETWELKSVPPADTYSYTAPGHRWINHEWLSEVLLFLIFDAFGSTGLLLFKLMLGLFIVHLLSSLYFAREKNGLAYLVHFFLAVTVMAPGFMTRPHLFTFLFLTLLVFLLQKFFDGNHKVLAWSPLLMLFWVNCHGGVVAGMGLYGMVAGIEWVRCFFTKEKHGKLLMGYFALSCLALLLHPQGYQLWIFFYESLTLPRAIGEWNPVPLYGTHYWQLKILAALFAVSLLFPGRKRLWEIAIILLTLVYGFKHQRHAVLAAIVLTPYLPIQLAQLLKKFPVKEKLERLSSPVHLIMQAGLVLFIGLNLFGGISKYRINDYKILVEPGVYPTYAAQFMEANRINGNILVPFDWGEYLIWKRPKSKVSIDGRFRTAYPEHIIRQNLAFSAGQAEGMALLEQHPTDIVMVRKKDPNRELMEKGPNWLKIYEDPVAKIFIRKSNPPGPLEERLSSRTLIDPKDPPPMDFPG